jgi:lysozyme
MRTINNAGLKLIQSFEGLKLEPYLDSAKIPTIGWGTIMYENGQAVTMHDPAITADRANELLMWEVMQKCKSVAGMVTVSINDNEFDALCCFAYNVGVGGLHGSTLLKMLNANADRTTVGDQFLRWNKAGGVEVGGLTRRRQAERALFLQPAVQSDSDDQLPSGPSDEDINSKLKDIEDEIMKK